MAYLLLINAACPYNCVDTISTLPWKQCLKLVPTTQGKKESLLSPVLTDSWRTLLNKVVSLLLFLLTRCSTAVELTMARKPFKSLLEVPATDVFCASDWKLPWLRGQLRWLIRIDEEFFTPGSSLFARHLIAACLVCSPQNDFILSTQSLAHNGGASAINALWWKFCMFWQVVSESAIQ